MLEINAENFDVLAASGPLVVDFWTEWCVPCRALRPMLEELAAEYDGRISFATCDVEQNDEIACRFHVRSVPTLVFLKNGEVVDTHIGSATREVLAEKLQKIR